MIENIEENKSLISNALESDRVISNGGLDLSIKEETTVEEPIIEEEEENYNPVEKLSLFDNDLDLDKEQKVFDTANETGSIDWFRLGLTQSEIDKNKERKLEAEAKMFELGWGVRLGDKMFNELSPFYSTVRDVVELGEDLWDSGLNLNKSVRDTQLETEELRIDNTLDSEWIENTDLLSIIKDYGITDYEIIKELLTNKSNNEKQFNKYLTLYGRRQESIDRNRLEVTGDYFFIAASVLADPLLLVGSAKIFNTVQAYNKAKNFGVGVSSLTQGATEMLFSGGYEYTRQLKNFESDNNKITIAGLFGGVISGSIGAYIRKMEIVDLGFKTAKIDLLIKNTDLDSVEIIKKLDDTVEADSSFIKREFDLSDDDLKMLLKNEKELDDLPTSFKNSKLDKIKKKIDDTLKQSETYRLTKNNIVELNKKIKENGC